MDFQQLAIEYKREFQKDQEGFIQQVGRFASIRGVLVQLYYQMVRDRQCDPIESLDPDDKRELWKEACRLNPELKKDQLLDLCRAIHGFGQFIQL